MVSLFKVWAVVGKLFINCGEPFLVNKHRTCRATEYLKMVRFGQSTQSSGHCFKFLCHLKALLDPSIEQVVAVPLVLVMTAIVVLVAAGCQALLQT